MNKTIKYYNTFYKDFIKNTLDANASSLHHYFLKHLPEGSTILDLGCGSGRDSKVFIEEGIRYMPWMVPRNYVTLQVYTLDKM